LGRGKRGSLSWYCHIGFTLIGRWATWFYNITILNFLYIETSAATVKEGKVEGEA